jgi:hypothetical protein
MSFLARLVLLLSAAGAVGAQDPAPTLPDFIKDLNDDSIEVRERASGELIRHGEGVMEALQKELLKAPGPEVRLRIGDILARLRKEKRRKEFKGGDIVVGLCALLREEKGDGSVVLICEIMNVDTVARPFVPIEAWDYRFPSASMSSNMAQGRIIVERISKEESRVQGGSFGYR